MKQLKSSYPVTPSSKGEKILNVLIVPALLLLVIMFFVMVNAFRESYYTEFSPRNQLYMLEEGNYGDFVSSYYSAHGDIIDGKDEKEKALRSTAEYVEAAFLSKAAQTAGDFKLQEQQEERMEQAYDGMGIYAGEAEVIAQILSKY